MGAGAGVNELMISELLLHARAAAAGYRQGPCLHEWKQGPCRICLDQTCARRDSNP